MFFGEHLPLQRESCCHPLAGLDGVNDDELAGLDLAGSHHLVEVDQRGRATDVADPRTPELNLFSRDAESVKKGRDVIFVELE